MSETKRYEVKVDLGIDPRGNRIRKSVYSTKSLADAKRKAAKCKAHYEFEHMCGGQAASKSMLFETWAIECLELYKKPFVKGNTYSGTYLAPVQQRLIPRIGKMGLDEIMPVHVQKYVNEMAKEYSPESVKKDYTILAFIMQHAVDNGLCKTNPAGRSIRLPKIEPPEKRAYTQAEYDVAYAFAKTHPNGLPIMLMMETGITRSELLGLRWEDIDLDKKTVSINQGLVAYQDLDEGKWVMESDGLKNKYRCRMIPLIDEELIRRLSAKPRAIHVGRQTLKPVFVFHSPQGKPYQPQNWSRRIFKRFMADLHAEHPELPVLTPHELRHTRATLWLAQGIPELMVAKLLGHCDLKMLAKIYDHTDIETLRLKMIKKTTGAE